MKTLEKLSLHTLTEEEMEGVAGGWFGMMGMAVASYMASGQTSEPKFRRFGEDENCDPSKEFCRFD